MKEILEDVERWRADGKKVAIATVVATRRSAPRPVGAKLAISETGELCGSVSGGCVESDVYENAREVLETGDAEAALLRHRRRGGLGGRAARAAARSTSSWSGSTMTDADRPPPASDRARGARACSSPSSRESRWARTPSCWRAVSATATACRRKRSRRRTSSSASTATGSSRSTARSVFAEVYGPPPRLLIYGAVDTAEAMCAAARLLGWRTIVADARAKFATPERLPSADEIIVEWPEEALARVAPDHATAVVVLTHDDKFDVPALKAALESEAFYVGALGSRRNQERRRERLLEAGVDEEAIERIAGPCGLDIGAESQPETALSILAEALAVRMGRDGGKLEGIEEAHTRRGGSRMTERVEKTDAEWQAELDPDRYQVLRCGATEAPWSGELNLVHDDGMFKCGACGAELFRSDTKFDSGSGWPSFFAPLAEDAVETEEDLTHGMRRTEVRCATCDSHLGHVFPDGPQPTGLRYCINSLALDFEPEDG